MISSTHSKLYAQWRSQATLAAAAVALAFATCLPGCASAAPQAASPAAPPAAASAVPEPPRPYQRHADEMYLALVGEMNPFGRQVIARMWVAVAGCDSSQPNERLGAAREAQAKADADVAEISEKCSSLARSALRQAAATKDMLEQRYLAMGDSAPKLEECMVDGEIHAVRDSVESLQNRLSGCPITFD